MRRFVSLALVISIGAAGCAEHITFHSIPEGAEVWLNGRDLGRTPTSAEVEYDAFTRYQVVLKKDGYQVVRAPLATQINSAALLGTIAGVFCFPCLVSLIWIQQPLRDYTFTLTPEVGAPPPMMNTPAPTPAAVGVEDQGGWDHPTQSNPPGPPARTGAGWGAARSPDAWPTPTATPPPEHF